MNKIDSIVEKYLLSNDFIQTFCNEHIFEDPEFCLDFALTNYFQDYLITMFTEEIVDLVIEDYEFDTTGDLTDWEKMYLFKYLVDEIESPSMMADYVKAYAYYDNTIYLEKEYITSTTHKLVEKLNIDIHEKIVEYCLEHKDNLIYVSRHIAIQKIKRSQIYNFGLGLKLSMKNCGIEITV